MDTKQNMLIKVASMDKSAALVARIALTNSMAKVAKKAALQDYMEKVAAGEKGSFADSLSNAWQGIQNWWADDANKAGLATGALGGLATYGLTGLIPGLKRNQAARLGLAGLGALGGYKGGQWGANKLMDTGYGQGAGDVATEANKYIGDMQQQHENELGQQHYISDRERVIANTQLENANNQIADLTAKLEAAEASGNPAAMRALQDELAQAKQLRDESLGVIEDLTAKNKALQTTVDEYNSDPVQQQIAAGRNAINSANAEKRTKDLASLQKQVDGLINKQKSAFGEKVTYDDWLKVEQQLKAAIETETDPIRRQGYQTELQRLQGARPDKPEETQAPTLNLGGAAVPVKQK